MDVVDLLVEPRLRLGGAGRRGGGWQPDLLGDLSGRGVHQEDTVTEVDRLLEPLPKS